MRQVGEDYQWVEEVEAGNQVVVEAQGQGISISFIVMGVIPAIDLNQLDGDPQVKQGVEEVEYDQTDVFGEVLVDFVEGEYQ